MSTKRTGCILLLALLAAASGAWAQDAVLRVAQVADISNLDPHKMNDVYTANVAKQIFSNLVKMNKAMEIQKDLAESWENPDARTWVFQLKKGVKFHNGEELTSGDVKYSLERVLDPKNASPGARLVSEVQKVEAVDRYTVRLTTKQPFAPLLTNLTRYEMAILNEKAVREAGDDFGKRPVGTGPFQFKEHHHGNRVVLSRFDGYFEGPAKVSGVVYRAIPEDATRVVEMESGGIDILYNLPPQDFDRLNKNPRVQAIEALFQATTFVGMNTKVKPFDNPIVRQALNYAVDKQAIIEAVWFNRGAPAAGPHFPEHLGLRHHAARGLPVQPGKGPRAAQGGRLSQRVRLRPLDRPAHGAQEHRRDGAGLSSAGGREGRDRVLRVGPVPGRNPQGRQGALRHGLHRHRGCGRRALFAVPQHGDRQRQPRFLDHPRVGQTP